MLSKLRPGVVASCAAAPCKEPNSPCGLLMTFAVRILKIHKHYPALNLVQNLMPFSVPDFQLLAICLSNNFLPAAFAKSPKVLG